MDSRNEDFEQESSYPDGEDPIEHDPLGGDGDDAVETTHYDEQLTEGHEVEIVIGSEESKHRVLEHVYDGEVTAEQEIQQESADEEFMEEDGMGNGEMVIFKTDGDEDSVITYSIPASTANEYVGEGEDSEYETIIIRDDLNSHQSYQIINGYLVPTHSQSDSGQMDVQPQPIPITPEELKLTSAPIKRSSLTPEALRQKSLRQPDKLLIIYHCSFCASAYEDFCSIKIHEAQHVAAGDPLLNNLNPQTNYLGVKLTGSEFKHNCPFCLMGFHMSSQLGKHIRSKHKKQKKAHMEKLRTQASQAKKLKRASPSSERFDNSEEISAAANAEIHTFMVVDNECQDGMLQED